MRFKHLTLQGYKSFANKSEFLFPTGVTAIVGPNGSGKSNIADAIRWALGEQRITSLRGKSTADMIYAGGRRRARAGMAEVAITLDNTDSWLPIEFSEVTISRRAYRSGQNEYLLNGSQVRLRDINELLAAGGFSRRAYTVIGQGMVDTALSLRPEERRDLFEEAAGISAYRKRREDALKRLQETQHNLERVYDIVNEITPRLHRLEQEVDQVEEHRRMVAHLERLQRTWYGYHWGQRQSQLAQAIERAAYLQSVQETYRQRVNTLGQQLAHQRQRESELRIQLRDWHAQSAQLLDQVNEARRALAVNEERIRLLRARREELLEELAPMKDQAEAQAKQVAQARDGTEQAALALDQCRQKLSVQEREWLAVKERAQDPMRRRDQAEHELRQHHNVIDRLRQRLSDLRAEEAHLVSERAVAQERARQLAARRAEAQAELTPLSTQEKEQKTRVAQVQTQIEQREQALTEQRMELTRLERQWQAIQRQAEQPDPERGQIERRLRDERTTLEQLDQALLNARASQAQVKGELEALTRMYESGTAYDTGVQALLQADLEGVLGPLANCIQVPPKWERAIEAALGAQLQAVVIDRASSAEHVRQVLESAGGRLTVLPMDSLRAPPALPHQALCAADVIDSRPDVRPAVESVLGLIALCETKSAARALQPKMPAGTCCVSRDGILWHANGAITVGKGGNGGVLASQRARRELPGRLERIKGRQQEIEAQKQDALERVAALEKALESHIQRAAADREQMLHAEREKISQGRTEVAVIQESLRNQQAILHHESTVLESIQHQRATLQNQVDRLTTEFKATQTRIAELVGGSDPSPESAKAAAETSAQPHRKSQIERIRKRGQEVEAQLQSKEQETARLEARLDQLTQKAEQAKETVVRLEREMVGQVRTQVAVAEEGLHSQQRALQREEQLLEQLRAQIAARRRRVKELENERRAIIQRTDDVRREVSEAERELDQVRQRIQPAEDELTQLGEAQTSQEEEERQAQRRAREAEARHGQAQLKVDRCRDELKLLARQVEEDLGLVDLTLTEEVTAQTPLPLWPVVSELPIVEELPQGLEDEIHRLKAHLRRIGHVNPNAPQDYEEVQERYTFLTEQSTDLEQASRHLQQVIAELDEMMEQAFQETFKAVAAHFEDTFTTLFNGGTARLELTQPEDLMNTGVDIIARPPGKRSQRLALLSGGERSLTAVALLFAILQVSPAPFCVLDEVDAALDEINVGRFCDMLKDLSPKTQFIVITHNRGTVESADTIYGISMGTDGVSQVVSLKLDE